jgi:pyruvyltransferase
MYGDPALLLPRLYSPANLARRYRIGITPHVVDRDDPAVCALGARPDVTIIDLYRPTLECVEAIVACDMILSSSLHGLVVADAYGIPSGYVLFSDKVIGGGFKFRDYLKGINVDPYPPLDMRQAYPSISVLERSVHSYSVSTGITDKLMAACPFRKGK